MKRHTPLYGAIVVFLLLLVSPCGSLNLLILKKSERADFNNPDIESPTRFDRVQCDYGIGTALADNGYTYTTVDMMPSDLTPYDVIFVILGFPYLDFG